MKKDFIVRRSITMVEGKPHVVTYSEQELVRCKDCNKRGTSECYVENASGELAFPWIQPDDWFCADGRKDGDVDG